MPRHLRRAFANASIRLVPALACLAATVAVAPAAADTVSVSSRQSLTRSGPLRIIGGRAQSNVVVNQTVVIQRAPERDPFAPVSFADLPATTGIARAPLAPPTIYRIAGPRSAAGDAEEARMLQVNPGARVITPADVEPEPRHRRAMGAGAFGPRIIVIGSR